jgi:hypothetical protein
MSEIEQSRRAFFASAGRTLTGAAALSLLPATAFAATAAGLTGVDAATGEPLDAGLDCDRERQL